MVFGKVKLVKGEEEPLAVKEARNALARLVARHKTAQKALDDGRAAVDQLRDHLYGEMAQASAEAKKTLTRTRTAYVEHIANPDSPAPAMTIAQAQAAIEDSAAQENAIEQALEAAKARIPDLEHEVNMAAISLPDGANSVFKADPRIRTMCETFVARSVEFMRLWSSLRYLESIGVVPIEFRGRFSLPTDRESQAAYDWMDVRKALMDDASTPLPL